MFFLEKTSKFLFVIWQEHLVILLEILSEAWNILCELQKKPVQQAHLSASGPRPRPDGPRRKEVGKIVGHGTAPVVGMVGRMVTPMAPLASSKSS